jgi:hypothetical protein
MIDEFTNFGEREREKETVTRVEKHISAASRLNEAPKALFSHTRHNALN